MRGQIHGGSLMIFSANFKLRKSGPRGTQWWNQKQMVTSRRQQPPRTETCILPELCESWSQFPTYLRLKMVAMLVVDLMMNSLLIPQPVVIALMKMVATLVIFKSVLNSPFIFPSYPPYLTSLHPRSSSDQSWSIFLIFWKASQFTTLSQLYCSEFVKMKFQWFSTAKDFNITLSKGGIKIFFKPFDSFLRYCSHTISSLPVDVDHLDRGNCEIIKSKCSST